jgi:hypothetical protein
LIETFALKPENFAGRVHSGLGHVGLTANELEERLEQFAQLAEETRGLCKSRGLLEV